MRILGTLAAAAAFIASGAAAQQEAAAAPPADIVVTGKSPRQAQQFANDLTVDDPYSSLPLYERESYCPGVVGLPAAQNRQIASRMRQVADAAGVRPAPADCLTSALVIFADDREAMLKRFRQLHPEYFLELTGEEITYQGRSGPVMAWKLLARVDRNGVPVGVDENGIQIIESAFGMNRFEAGSRPLIAMSVLVIEKAAVRGLTPQQIGDYAFMRSVTESDPTKLRAPASDTILKVVDLPIGSPTPLSLTAWDLAYVRSRYSVNRWNYGPTQMSKIRAEMRKAARGASAAD